MFPSLIGFYVPPRYLHAFDCPSIPKVSATRESAIITTIIGKIWDSPPREIESCLPPYFGINSFITQRQRTKRKPKDVAYLFIVLALLFNKLQNLGKTPTLILTHKSYPTHRGTRPDIFFNSPFLAIFLFSTFSFHFFFFIFLFCGL